MKRLLLGALALTTLGLTACGAKPVADASTKPPTAPPPTFTYHPPTTEAPTTTTDYDVDTQIMSIDVAWSSKGADVCSGYADVRGQVDNDTLDSFMVKKFEEGFGQALKPAARKHLLDLIHAC